MSELIKLGSGDLYICEFDTAMPDYTDIEKEENRVAHIEKGATIAYSNEWKEVEDSKGVVVATFLTKEEVKLNSGLLTWNGNMLAKLCQTARVTETQTMRTVKIGGTKAITKYYVIHFVHTKQDGTKIRCSIKGKNQAGFEFTFEKDNPCVLNTEFKAFAHDSEGTLLLFSEELVVPTTPEPEPEAPGAPTNVTAVAGDGQATVSFTAPTSDGGSPITGYIVTAVPGNITFIATGTSTTIIFPGLTNGVTYQFKVQAINEVGTGAESGLSDEVTPTEP